MRLRIATILWGGAAVASVSLAWLDPWAGRTASAPMVSTRSAARRVFPTLADRELSRATVELQSPEGPPVRLVPGAEGSHQVMEGDLLIGPADPDAIDGAWASLRMATTLRAVPRGTDVGAGQGGTIRVIFADETVSLALGHEAPAGNGLYGVMEHEGGEAWVVEDELSWLIAQPATTWLSSRLLLAEPDEVVSLAWGEQLGLSRAEDGLWRVQTGSEPALLSADAVERRMERLFSARLEPLLARDAAQAESLRPWLAVATADGRVQSLAVGGACPGEPERRLLDRGPGLLGCVPAEVTEPWAVNDPDAGLLEARLFPYEYGRVLAIELSQPETRSLKRRTGGWVISEQSGPDARERSVSEAEVYRWFSARGGVELAPIEGEPPEDFEPETTLALRTDTGALLTLRCTERLCARDEGPPRRVVGDAPLSLAFRAETFLDRSLVSLDVADVRSVEVLDGGGQGQVARQSVHLDHGAWRLDAPRHPDGDAALDQTRLETLLAVVSGLRAEDWVDEEPPVERSLVFELTPNAERPASLTVSLHGGCVVGVNDKHAKISDSDCEALGGDLLFDDPLRAWIGSARSLEIQRGNDALLLRPQGKAWVADADTAGLDELVAHMEAWRSRGLGAGPDPGAVEYTVTVRRDTGPSLTVEMGAGFARVRGQDWYYVEAAPMEEPTVVPPENPTGAGPDPGASREP